MENEKINQLIINTLRAQRIEADDRSMQAIVNLEIANEKVKELEKELKALKDKELSP